MGQPGEGAGPVHEGGEHHPVELEGVDDEHVHGKGDERVVQHVGILQVDCRVLDIVARVQQQLSFSVEFDCL